MNRTARSVVPSFIAIPTTQNSDQLQEEIPIVFSEMTPEIRSVALRSRLTLTRPARSMFPDKVAEKDSTAETVCESEEFDISDKATDTSTANTNVSTSVYHLPVPWIDVEQRQAIPVRCSLLLTTMSVSTLLETMHVFFRRHSIPVQCHLDGSIMRFRGRRISALSSSCLHFVVLLWRPRHVDDNKSDNDHSDDDQSSSTSISTSPTQQELKHDILVEVQRRHGCPIEMQYIRRALFSALKASDNTLFPMSSSSSPESSSLNLGKRQFMIPLHFCRRVYETCRSGKTIGGRAVAEEAEGTSPPPLTDNNNKLDYVRNCIVDATNIAVEKALTMMTNENTDCQRLGLESLCCLTDNSSANNDSMKGILLIQALLHGKKSTAVKDQVALQNALLRFLDNTGTFKEEEHVSSLPLSGSFYMTCLTLQILANVLALVAVSNPANHFAPPPTVPSEDSWMSDAFWHSVLDKCRKNIGRSAQQPCMAVVSMDVVKGVLLVDQLTRMVLQGNERRHGTTTGDTFFGTSSYFTPAVRSRLLEDLIKTNSAGMLDHAGLEQKSGELIDMLR